MFKLQKVRRSWAIVVTFGGATGGTEGGKLTRDVSEGWERKEEEKEGVSHIPGLMHGAIDSSLLPARCPHFKGRLVRKQEKEANGGRRWRLMEGGEEGRRNVF